MNSNESNLDEEIKKFHLPRWNEIPEIDLYIDQVVSLLQNYLSNYIKSDNGKDNNIITKTMINNYVKHGVVKAPVNKKYSKEHIAYLFVIFILKQIYSIDEISKLIKLAIKTSPIDIAYNRFCSEIEKAIKMTFTGESYKRAIFIKKCCTIFCKQIICAKNIFKNNRKMRQIGTGLFCLTFTFFPLCNKNLCPQNSQINFSQGKFSFPKCP